jgi:hypothetical protein
MLIFARITNMLKHIFDSFFSFIILLHCVGITQLASSLSLDKSTFVGMLNMTEEETKKEKESKEDTCSDKDLKYKHSGFALHPTFPSIRETYLASKNRIEHQFLSENPSPPPDSLA